MQTISSDAPNGDGSAGETLLIDLEKGKDVGNDHYATSDVLAQQATNGVIDSSESSIDTDGGSAERIKIVGRGGRPDERDLRRRQHARRSVDNFGVMMQTTTRAATATATRGPTRKTTAFPKSEPTRPPAPTTTSTSSNSGDTGNAFLVSTSPAGAVTNVTINGSDSDNGSDQSHDDEEDDETIPGGPPSHSDDNIGLTTDDITFDDSDEEQDTARDGETINISVLGLVNPNDSVNSTETITLGNTLSTTDKIDDPGAEIDAPTGDSEEDDLTDASTLDDNLTVEDVLQSQETIAGSDGSTTKTITDDDDSEVFADSEQDALGDYETTNAAADHVGELDTNDETDDSKSKVSDTFTGRGTVAVTTWAPVANGTFTSFQKMISNDNDLTTDVSTEDETDDSQAAPQGIASSVAATDSESDDLTDDLSDVEEDTTNTIGSSVLNVVDPTTGMTTNILGSDTGIDVFSDDASDHSTDDSTNGNTNGNTGITDSVGETAKETTDDDFDDDDTLEVTVQGSPQPGETVNYSAQLNLTDSGDDKATGSDTSNAPGSDAGGDTFQDTDTESVSGKSQSTDTNTVNTDDGQGNTVNLTATITDNTVIGGTSTDTDNGQETFADAGGAPTSDNESDTDNASGDIQVKDVEAELVQSTVVTIDPTSGLQTTATTNDSSGDTTTDTDVVNSKDVNASSLSAGATDTDSGEDDETEHDAWFDPDVVVIAIAGTTPQGQHVDEQETTTVTDSGTDDSTDDDTRSPDGTNTEIKTNASAGQGTITDVAQGTVVTTDPTTGGTTTAGFSAQADGTASDAEPAGDSENSFTLVSFSAITIDPSTGQLRAATPEEAAADRQAYTEALQAELNQALMRAESYAAGRAFVAIMSTPEALRRFKEITPTAGRPRAGVCRHDGRYQRHDGRVEGGESLARPGRCDSLWRRDDRRRGTRHGGRHWHRRQRGRRLAGLRSGDARRWCDRRAWVRWAYGEGHAGNHRECDRAAGESGDCQRDGKPDGRRPDRRHVAGRGVRPIY